MSHTTDPAPTYKKISTRSQDPVPIIPDTETPKNDVQGKKRKIIDVIDSDEIEEVLNDSEDVWADYRYTQSDIDRMNALVKRYESCGLTGTKKRKITEQQSEQRVTQHVRRIVTRSMSKRLKTDADIVNPTNQSVLQPPHPDADRPIDLDVVVDKMLGWVSATKTKYHLLHDQAIDWLSMYFDKIGIGPELPTEEEAEENKKLLKDASHIDVLFEGGNVFERKIFEELKDIYGDDFVLVFSEEDMKNYREQRSIDGLIREKNQYVKTLMNRGVPIIAQAPLINDTNKTFGVADILIRSDYLEILFKTFTPDAEVNFKAPFLTMRKTNNRGDDSYHYRVIDCKWTTMVLCVDGLTIRNEGLFPAYKGQLAVYTAALEALQGYTPNIAYIMSKAWRIDKANIPESQKHMYKGFSAFDRPGVINYAERDRDYLARTKEAIQWMQWVVTEGRDWRYELTKLSKPELYPNMNKSYNPVYDKVKDALAKRYGDPTMVWYVGTGHRDNAHAKGIYDVRDPRCTLDVLGIPNKGRGPIINEILEINRNNQTEDLVRPKKIKNNLFGWRDDNILDYFVDFETINYNLFTNPYDMDIDNSYFESDVTFMIGFGFNHNPDVDSHQLIDSLNIDRSKCDCFIHIDKDKGWEFVCLHLVNFKLQNELEMYRLFYQFIILRQEIFTFMYDPENNGTTVLQSRMFHWTAAEIRFMQRAITRIRSGEYTRYHMENRGLKFEDDTGEQVSVRQVQKELDRLLDNFDASVTWIDMCKVFEQVPIVVKGSFRFKLKHIGNAFCKNGLIDTRWDDGRMSDGFRAMLEAIKLYRSNRPMTKEEQMYKEIIDYNEVDCRVVWEIVNYLRANH